MTPELPLPQAFWPVGDWREPVRWEVRTLAEAFTVRAAAGELVGQASMSDAEEHLSRVYASARARVETTMGELVVNGLRHGGAQVRASLTRGRAGHHRRLVHAGHQHPRVGPDHGRPPSHLVI